jgi:hypothetical protein
MLFLAHCTALLALALRLLAHPARLLAGVDEYVLAARLTVLASVFLAWPCCCGMIFLLSALRLSLC